MPAAATSRSLANTNPPNTPERRRQHRDTTPDTPLDLTSIPRDRSVSATSKPPGTRPRVQLSHRLEDHPSAAPNTGLRVQPTRRRHGQQPLLEPCAYRRRAIIRGELWTSQEPCSLQSKPQALDLLSTGLHKRQTQLRSIDNALEVKGVLRHDSALSASHDRRDERTQ